MRTLVRLAALLAATLPAVVSAAPVAFFAPAGSRAVNVAVPGAPYAAILPSGRLVTPFGTSTVAGVGALGLALSPDGRFALVAAADRHFPDAHSGVDPGLTGGAAVRAFDARTMRPSGQFTAAGETLDGGIAAVDDPLVPGRTLVFAAGDGGRTLFVDDLDAAGTLTADAVHRIALDPPAGTVPPPAGPVSLTVAAGGRTIDVIDAANDRVLAIDAATRRVVGAPQTVGAAPFAAAVAGKRLLVTDEGVGPTPDPQHASSLALLAQPSGGAIDPAAPPAFLPMDEVPDGVRAVGGAHPSALAVTPGGTHAFVAMTNVDRIATVTLEPQPVVAGGTELRLFDRGPYGTQPDALALAHDGTRLYVALAGLNAIAVLDTHDPLHPHRLGLIPTGWLPTALALDAGDRALFVLNTFGFGHDREALGGPDAGARWSTLEKIDLAQVQLRQTTVEALKDARRTSLVWSHPPAALHDAVTIVTSPTTFDAIFGDFAGVEAPLGGAVTPNLHALAHRYGLAANWYAPPHADRDGDPFADGDNATVVAIRDALLGTGDGPAGAVDEAPREGSILAALHRRGIPARAYGSPASRSGAPPADPQAVATAFLDEERTTPAALEPRFALVRLDAGGPALEPGAPDAVARATAEDHAVGTIVAGLSRLPSWKRMAVFVVAQSPGVGRDRVDTDRSMALVISPYARRGFIGRRHLSPASALKTIEAILHVPPVGLGDLLATDMTDFFGPARDARPYAVLGTGTHLSTPKQRTSSLSPS